MNDSQLDALLAKKLAPPTGEADLEFILRVENAVAEAERYRRWKQTFWNQIVTEALTILAIGCSVAFLSQAPAIGKALTTAPWLLAPALLSLFLFWKLVRSRPRVLS